MAFMRLEAGMERHERVEQSSPLLPPPQAHPVLRDDRLSPVRGKAARSRPDVIAGEGLALERDSEGVAVAGSR